MSFWSEIRPPNPAVGNGQRVHLPYVRSLRRGLAFLPLGLALIAALLGLAVFAHQQSASDQPLIVESVDLPTTSTSYLIDLNTATIAELASLPGVGETRARAIIASREQTRFTSLADLARRGILRPSQLPAITDQATVYVTLE